MAAFALSRDLASAIYFSLFFQLDFVLRIFVTEFCALNSLLVTVRNHVKALKF
jgi:hypothetical protein